jgi:cytochrome b561
MPPELNSADRYDRLTIVLHWLIAALVAGQWLGAHAIDWFPKGPLRVDARSLHILFGAIVGFLMIVRVAWRVGGGRRLLPEGPPLADLAARAMKLALYGLILGVVAVGVALALTRGDSLFGVLQLPSLGGATPESRHALAEQIVEYHELGANLILLLAGLHSIAAIIHQVWLKDRLMQRMALR